MYNLNMKNGDKYSLLPLLKECHVPQFKCQHAGCHKKYIMTRCWQRKCIECMHLDGSIVYLRIINKSNPVEVAIFVY
jgi:hypothetical protein